MKCAAQILLLDQMRQRVFFCRFKFTAVLAELRRDEIEIERAIQLGFVAHLRNLRSFPFPLRIRWQRPEAIFIQRPAAFERAIAHLDVVLLVAGKIVEGKRIFCRADNAQIALDSGAKPRTRFRGSLRNH